MGKILEFKNTNFAYNDTNAFDDLSLEIIEGDIVTLIGPSGSGKTTLLKMICHLLPNDSIYYKERPIADYKSEELRKELVVIFDNPITSATPLGELKKYVTKIGLSKNEVDKRVDDFVEYFSMGSFINIEKNKLTREEKYLIKILRYLIIEPKFIAIDGILSCVGDIYKKKIFSYIKKHHMTLLNITSDLNDALFGTKLFVLEKFVLILEGSTLSVLKTDTLLKRLGFRLPLPVDLSIELIHYDVLKKIYTDNEKLVKALWK